MIIIEVSIYAGGHVFPHIVKKCYCYYKYYFSSIIRNISLRTKLVKTSATLVTAHPPLPHPTKILIVPGRLGCIGAEVSTNNNFCN